MARDTSKKLRNMVMYQVFVRNFSKEGTFEKVRERLDDIKALGVDIIWLMPIHPIGKKKRKGTLGSPYAIRDYRAINPEFGTMGDFQRLVDGIHERGMKCIIDVVYNHTSPDSVLSEEHPEWFYHKEDGGFGNRVGDWSDIIDLDYGQKDLWRYQIDTLRMWAKTVDGFRCDVAPLIPIAFWEQARKEVEEVRPSCIWLSESVDPGFIIAMRGSGLNALSDGEIYNAFDICYDYDVYGAFRDVLSGKGSLQRYAEAVNRQEYSYPENYVKLRFLENHDQTRAHHIIPDQRALRNWTAFIYFQKGMPLIYAGQEIGEKHQPSLFDKDTVSFEEQDDIGLVPLMQKLYAIKKNEVFTDSIYRIKAWKEKVLTATHESKGKRALGVFTLQGEREYVEVDFADGIYKNLLDGSHVEICRGSLSTYGEPIILIDG